MRTIKVYGGGPLVGKVFYGTLEYVFPMYSLPKKHVILSLDEAPFAGERKKWSFDIESGFSIDSSFLTNDLLRVDPVELDQALSL